MNSTLTAAPADPGPRRQYPSQEEELLRRARQTDAVAIQRVGSAIDQPIPFALTEAAERLFGAPYMSAADKAAHDAASHVRTEPLSAEGLAALARLENALEVAA